MMEHKNKIPNWLHYWKVAQSRPDLKEFKDLLAVNANNPNLNIGESKIMTLVPETIQVPQQTPDGIKLVDKVIRKEVIKTFNQLVKELAPKETNDDGKFN